MKKTCIVLLLVASTVSTSAAACGEGQDYNCSVFSDELPEPWRTIVNGGLNVALLGLCTVHDLCYGDCNGPQVFGGLDQHKLACDLEFLAGFEAWCNLVFAEVVDAELDGEEWLVICLAAGAAIFGQLNGPDGEEAYGCDQCFLCDDDVCSSYQEYICPGNEMEIEFCGEDIGPAAWNWSDCSCEEGYSPIILSLGDNRLDLTDSAGGVDFDYQGDAVVERSSWTAANTDDAFLAYDRDGNGTIDDGTELFGNFTEQPSSTSLNGFSALALFDHASRGGDGDREITANDAIFHELVLWTDSNHDGISQPGEIAPLWSSGVVSIDLDYRESEHKDRYGNILRYRSQVRFADHRVQFAYDVIFLP